MPAVPCPVRVYYIADESRMDLVMRVLYSHTILDRVVASRQHRRLWAVDLTRGRATESGACDREYTARRRRLIAAAAFPSSARVR